MSLDDRVLLQRVQISHHGQDTSGLTQLLEVGSKFGALVHDQNFHGISCCLSQNRRNVAKVSIAVMSCLRAPLW